MGFVKARKAPESCKSRIPEETFENVNKNDSAVVKRWWGPCSLTSVKTLGIPPWFFPATLDLGPLSCLLLPRGWKRQKSSRRIHGGAPESKKKNKETRWQGRVERGGRRSVDTKLILLLFWVVNLLNCGLGYVREVNVLVLAGQCVPGAGDTAGTLSGRAVPGRGGEWVPIQTRPSRWCRG